MCSSLSLRADPGAGCSSRNCLIAASVSHQDSIFKPDSFKSPSSDHPITLVVLCAQSSLAAPPVPDPSVASVTHEPDIADPEPFFGDPSKCKSFLLQCSLVLGQKPLTCASHESKIQFVISLLRGRARDWRTALWDLLHSLEIILCSSANLPKCLIALSVVGRQAGRQTGSFSPNARAWCSVADYSIDFWMFVASAGWNNAALRGASYRRLSNTVMDELAAKDESESLD